MNAKITFYNLSNSSDPAENKAMLATLLSRRGKNLLCSIVMQSHTLSNYAPCMRIM